VVFAVLEGNLAIAVVVVVGKVDMAADPVEVAATVVAVVAAAEAVGMVVVGNLVEACYTAEVVAEVEVDVAGTEAVEQVEFVHNRSN
jgi:hypothetical protein